MSLCFWGVFCSVVSWQSHSHTWIQDCHTHNAWTKWALFSRFKASSAAINVSSSAKLYLQWENIVTVTLQGWLRSCRLLRGMSSHQNESCTRIIAFRETLIAPRGIIHPGSVLVWSKKNETTKRKFGFNEINSSEMRQVIKQLNMSARIYLQADVSSFSLLPFKSHKYSNSGLVTEYPDH